MDWSTLGCGRYGHSTYAPDEPELRAQLVAPLADGQAWRCLRCGTFVPGAPDASGPAASAPVVLRGKEVRSRFILRIFAVERFLRALVFGAAAYGLWRFRYAQNSIEQAFHRELPLLRVLFRQLGYNIDHSKLVGLLQHALTLSSGTLTLLACGLALYAAVELVEGTGLWLARRWGEYFAMIATSLGLPLEIYDLTRKLTVTTLVLFAVNLALVLYLVITKRLFGIRGGKAAYDARLTSESVMTAAIRAAGQTDASQDMRQETEPGMADTAEPGQGQPGQGQPGQGQTSLSEPGPAADADADHELTVDAGSAAGLAGSDEQATNAEPGSPAEPATA